MPIIWQSHLNNNLIACRTKKYRDEKNSDCVFVDTVRVLIFTYYVLVDNLTLIRVTIKLQMY